MRNANQTGFTLTELMIAMVLGVILAGGVVNLFVVGQRSFRMDENVARMQDEGRFAINELARDVRMAGYIGEIVHPVAILPAAGLATATDCGVAGQPNWILDFFDALTGEINTLTAVDNATGATANAGYSCINAGELWPQTDVVGIKRFVGRSVPPAGMVANTIYMETNALEGVMFKDPLAVGAGVAAPFEHVGIPAEYLLYSKLYEYGRRWHSVSVPQDAQFHSGDRNADGVRRRRHRRFADRVWTR